MKTIFDETFDGINVKVYYLPELGDLYLYVDDEMIAKFFFGLIDTFEEDIKLLFPSWLSELIGSNITNIIHELYIRLTNYWYGIDVERLYDTLSLDFEDDVRDVLYDELDKMCKKYYDPEYLRYCQVGNAEQELQYKNSLAKGYYGIDDKALSFKGIDYKIGCNYGH